MNIISRLFWVLVIVSQAACKKAEDRQCLKFSGNYAERIIPLEDFNRLDLHEHIKFILVQDSANYAVIKGGKNLLNWVNVSQESSLVTVTNRNRCNFLRKFAVPTVELHFTNLVNILFQGTESLVNKNTITTNYLTLTLRDGAGSMNLTVHAIDIKVENTNGWGNLMLKGFCQTFRSNLMGDGAFDCRDLSVANSLKIVTVSSRDQLINASGIPLSVQIDGVGNVRYWGNPTAISLNKYGTGNLINGN